MVDAGTRADVVVIGGGMGGYGAAFYAADHGKKVILIEMEKRLGGVCLNKGCIPSKAFLQVTKTMEEAKESAHRGISFGEPKVNLEKLRAWKESVLDRLSGGIKMVAEKRNVTVMHGKAYFEGSQILRVETEKGQEYVEFSKAIIAVGSKPSLPKDFDLGNPRVMTSTEALDVPDIPDDLLVVGGGYIGMELGTVYATLGSRVVVVEAMDSILAGADPDLARPVMRYAQKNFKEVRLSTKVLKMSTVGKKIKVVLETAGEKKEELYDRVLVSIGRSPNCSDMGLENTQVTRDEKGFIKVDDTQATDDPHIYAVGDCVGGLMLAHKAGKEARIAVEALLGIPTRFDSVIPAVVFTDPEVAWCGLTEADARKRGIPVQVSRFPWSASGRALTYDRPDGVTKLIVEPTTERILGVGLAGHGAGELISEGVLAVEMGATVKDLAECVHPHPTLSETLMEAAENYFGTSAHSLPRREKTLA